MRGLEYPCSYIAIELNYSCRAFLVVEMCTDIRGICIASFTCLYMDHIDTGTVNYYLCTDRLEPPINTYCQGYYWLVKREVLSCVGRLPIPPQKTSLLFSWFLNQPLLTIIYTVNNQFLKQRFHCAGSPLTLVTWLHWWSSGKQCAGSHLCTFWCLENKFWSSAVM